MNRLFLLALACSSACFSFETSAELSEPAKIEQLTYTPPTNGSGYSSSGSYVSTHTPEQIVAVISCPHGKFVLNPTSPEARALFEQFKQGDSITVIYAEQYIRKRDQPRELYDLDFLYAVKRGSNAR